MFFFFFCVCFCFFFFNDTATTEIYTLSLHDALPILSNTHVSSNLYFQKYIPETNWRVILDFGIIAGAFLGAIAGRDFKIRIPQNRWRFLQVFIGGLLMGFGARLAYGCNIGHIMSGVPQLAISSFIALISIAGGAYIGAKIIVRLI